VDVVRRTSGIDIFRTDSCGKFSQVPGFFVVGLVRENAFVGTPEVGFSHFCGRCTQGETKLPASMSLASCLAF